MATDTYNVLLRGGPCNGQEAHLTADQFASEMTTCGGKVYRYAPDTTHPYIFQLASDLERGVPVGVTADPRSALSQIGALLRTLGHDVPRQITRQRATISRLRKATR
jgi:hypothetical protein